MNKCNEFRAKAPTILAKRFAASGRLLRCLSDNYLFAKIAYWIERIECWLTCEPTLISDTIEVGDTMTLLRWPDTLAVETNVQNLGTSDLRLYEDGLLVGVVRPMQTRRLPLSGRLMVEGKCLEGESTTVMISTRERCLCGDDPPPHYYSSNQPIGGNLL